MSVSSKLFHRSSRPGTTPGRRRRWLLAICVPLVACLAILGWVGYSAQRAVNEATGGTGGSVVSVLQASALNGESTGSVNILLAGNSADDTGHDGADLTDSIMVVHLDLSTKKVTMVSVPRDLEVQYKGQWMKINEVYVAAGDGITGLDALGQVVQQVTGLTINEHVLVGYTALKELVDDVGGIDVTINSSDSRGIHDEVEQLTISNGTHHIDGTVALALCRARNDTPTNGNASANYGLSGGDIDRQANQRLVLNALMTKLASSSTYANPVKLVELFNTLGSHMTTDLTVGQIERLRELSSELKGTTSTSIAGSTSSSLLVDHTSSSLGDTLIPAAGLGDYTQIIAWVNQEAA